MAARWNLLSEDEAKAHPLYGFKGWLVAVYVLVALLFLLHMQSAFSAGAIMMWETPGQVAVMRWITLAQAAALLPFLILAPLRRPAAARFGLWCLWAYALLPIAAVWLLIDIKPTKVMAVSGYNAVLGAVFTLYLLRSKRANVTFRRRVAAAL